MTTFDRHIPNIGTCEVIVTCHRRHIKLRNRIYLKQPSGEIIGYQYLTNPRKEKDDTRI